MSVYTCMLSDAFMLKVRYTCKQSLLYCIYSDCRFRKNVFISQILCPFILFNFLQLLKSVQCTYKSKIDKQAFAASQSIKNTRRENR